MNPLAVFSLFAAAGADVRGDVLLREHPRARWGGCSREDRGCTCCRCKATDELGRLDHVGVEAVVSYLVAMGIPDATAFGMVMSYGDES